MKRRSFVKFSTALLVFPATLLEACKTLWSPKSSLTASPENGPKIHDLISNLRITDRQPFKVSSDIRALLQEAIDSGLTLRALVGGHGYLGQALCKDGLLIDMRAHRYVAVDREKATLKAEAGARFIEIYRALADEKGELDLVLPTGDCPTVGLAGYTLGGGSAPPRLFALEQTSRWYGLVSHRGLLFRVPDSPDSASLRSAGPLSRGSGIQRAAALQLGSDHQIFQAVQDARRVRE